MGLKWRGFCRDSLLHSLFLDNGREHYLTHLLPFLFLPSFFYQISSLRFIIQALKMIVFIRFHAKKSWRLVFLENLGFRQPLRWRNWAVETREVKNLGFRQPLRWRIWDSGCFWCLTEKLHRYMQVRSGRTLNTGNRFLRMRARVPTNAPLRRLVHIDIDDEKFSGLIQKRQRYAPIYRIQYQPSNTGCDCRTIGMVKASILIRFEHLVMKSKKRQCYVPIKRIQFQPSKSVCACSTIGMVKASIFIRLSFCMNEG